MWDMITDMMPRRRRGGMNTLTAMALGASVGIAAWELMRRTNGGGGNNDNNTMSRIADTMMNAITQE